LAAAEKRGRAKIPSLQPPSFLPARAKIIKIQRPDFRGKKFGFCSRKPTRQAKTKKDPYSKNPPFLLLG